MDEATREYQDRLFKAIEMAAEALVLAMQVTDTVDGVRGFAIVVSGGSDYPPAVLTRSRSMSTEEEIKMLASAVQRVADANGLSVTMFPNGPAGQG